MDDPEVISGRKIHALGVTALAPIVPQILGSAFNIWYNTVIIEPMLSPIGLKQRFLQTVVVYNVIVFPLGIWLWVKRVRSLSPAFHQLRQGLTIETQPLDRLRRRLIHL